MKKQTTWLPEYPNRVSIHQRQAETDGTRVGDSEMDTIVGTDEKGVIVTLTERSTNILLRERLPQGKNPGSLAKAVIS